MTTDKNGLAELRGRFVHSGSGILTGEMVGAPVSEAIGATRIALTCRPRIAS